MKIEFTTLSKVDYDEAINYYKKESINLTKFYILKDNTIYILAIANHYKNPISYLDKF